MTGASQFLDLTDLRFWIVAGIAILLLAPIARSRLRDWVFAGVNTGAIAVLLGPTVLAGGLVITLTIWAAAHNLGRATAKRAIFVASLPGVLAIFLIHKVDIPQVAWFGPLKPVLAGLGFSYIALRAIELLRAIQEERHSPPTLLCAINYLMPFHMLAAGPIQAYDDFANQPIAPPLSRRGALAAIERITLGLFKKIVIVPILANTFLTGFTAHAAYIVLEVQVFYLWVYLDFSAYSDIAVGLGRLMGVHTPENFDRPLSARNITVFWERWHISLSLFIRRNLFIPVQLALVRKYARVSPVLSATAAFSVAFLLCGLWHGVSLRFLTWGAAHALALVLCNAYRHTLRSKIGRKGVARYLDNRPVRWLSTALTFEFVAFSIAFALYPGTFTWTLTWG